MQEGKMATPALIQQQNASPDAILQIAFGFAASKTLFSAIELGLFTELDEGAATAGEIQERHGLHPRSVRDFLDALVSMQLLERTDADGLYFNTQLASQFLVAGKSGYIGGMLGMMNGRLYPFWGSLTEALRTGERQNETKHGKDLFAELYSDPARLRVFLEAMSGLSAPAATAIARKFPWEKYATVVDVGTAQGRLPVEVAKAYPHLRAFGWDLPAVRPVFEEYVASNSLADRVGFIPGDFFAEPLAKADVLVMGHILHDWGLDEKMMLLRKAYDALPEGGALIVYESLIDDERRKNTAGLLMSLNMLIETPAGFDYTGADCREWMRQTGFRESRVEHLAGAESMVVGTK
jgi:hypothetical protein